MNNLKDAADIDGMVYLRAKVDISGVNDCWNTPGGVEFPAGSILKLTKNETADSRGTLFLIAEDGRRVKLRKPVFMTGSPNCHGYYNPDYLEVMTEEDVIGKSINFLGIVAEFSTTKVDDWSCVERHDDTDYVYEKWSNPYGWGAVYQSFDGDRVSLEVIIPAGRKVELLNDKEYFWEQDCRGLARIHTQLSFKEAA